MKAEIEPITAVIRVWVEDTARYGEPYEWISTVRYFSQTKVEIVGCTKRITPSIWKAIVKECESKGIETILLVTYANGVRRERLITVSAYSKDFRDEKLQTEDHD